MKLRRVNSGFSIEAPHRPRGSVLSFTTGQKQFRARKHVVGETIFHHQVSLYESFNHFMLDISRETEARPEERKI